MPHVFEPAPSGRARCRGCGERIAKGELRFGERLPNPFGEGEMSLWFHPACAAYKRPQPFLEALGDTAVALEDRDRLVARAEHGVAHRRLPRVDGAERAPTGRARCRSCREAIPKDSWRIRLVYYEEGRFQPSGFIHAACAGKYFETTELVERAAHFAPALSGDDLRALEAELTRAEPAG